MLLLFDPYKSSSISFLLYSCLLRVNDSDSRCVCKVIVPILRGGCLAVLFDNEQEVDPHFTHHLLQEVDGDSTPVQIGLEEIEGYIFVPFASSRAFLKAPYFPDPGSCFLFSSVNPKSWQGMHSA